MAAPAKQLEWAVNFARDPLPPAGSAAWGARRAELTGFLRRGLRTDSTGAPAWVSDEVVTKAHAAVRRVLGEWLEHGMVRATAPAVRVAVRVLTFPKGHPAAGRPYVDVDPVDYDDDAEAALLRVLFLLGAEGRRVHRCQAPARRSLALCGRWFASRPNVRYCSRACYNRAASRRFRGKLAR